MSLSNSTDESTMTYSLYLLKQTKTEYLISACGFVPTSTPSTYLFQMLKDTHFNMILSPKEGCELEIVFIKNLESNDKNKLAILDHYNNNHSSGTIKSLLKFKCTSIDNYIELNMLSLTSDEKIKNIVLQCFVTNYKDKLHISNPYFSITKESLNNIIK